MLFPTQYSTRCGLVRRPDHYVYCSVVNFSYAFYSVGGIFGYIVYDMIHYTTHHGFVDNIPYLNEMKR